MSTTIAAISSPAGFGRRGIVRISGPLAAGVVREACVAGDGAVLPPAERAAVEVRFADGIGSQPCTLLWMPGPASYTREDVAELHLPGAPPLLRAALARLCALGCVPAAPGEFTRRAFLNGRLDLTEAEGVLELVDAANDADRRAALALLAGGLAERLRGLRESFEELRALAEASLDFDESDTGHVPLEELRERVRALEAALKEALAWEVRRQPPSALPRVALVGAPNAGKSTLFNALVPGARALVSDVEGSTRDGASGLWSLAGSEVLLLDAPGLAAPAGEADRLAQELARRERSGADLWLHVVDASSAGLPELAEADSADPAAPPRPRVVVWSRTDRPGARSAPRGAVAVAAPLRRGLDELAARVAAELGLGPQRTDTALAAAAAPSLGRELSARHRRALETAGEDLARAAELLQGRGPLDVAADALRDATAALDGIAGRTTPEDVLDRIFARFCVGK